MQQQISAITLGIKDLPRSRRFYTEGFGWTPVFENPEIIFYQMNGLMLGTWLDTAMAADLQSALVKPGGCTLAHNVATREAVQLTIDHLAQYGGRILRQPDDPAHGGRRGHIADPDGHTWEIAWNPAWPIDAQGHVTFGL